MKSLSPVVTDHAVLRWLERVERLDLDALRTDMARAAAVGIAHGAGSVVVGAGKLVIRGGMVVTTLRRDAWRKDLLGDIEAVVSGDIVPRRKARRARRRR